MMLVRDEDWPEPTEEQRLAALRAQKRIDEYNATIRMWQARADEAQRKANETNFYKECFIRDLSEGPFWLCPDTRIPRRS